MALIHRLGGREGIEALVEDLVERVREDPEIGHYVAEADDVELTRYRTVLFSALLGGSEAFGGCSMRDAQAPFLREEGDVDVFIGLVSRTLAESSARPRDQRRVLRDLDRRRPTIVTSSTSEQGARSRALG